MGLVGNSRRRRLLISVRILSVVGWCEIIVVEKPWKTGICYLKFHLVATHFNLNAILFFGYFVYAVVIRSFYFSIMVLILLPSKKEKRRVNYIFGAISFDGVLLGWGTVYPLMLLARGSIQGRRRALDRRWKGSGWRLEDVRWDVWKMDSHACLGCRGNFILV